MRHTATILIGQDLKPFATRLGKYVLKYGEADASSYFTSVTWACENGKTEIKKAVKDDEAGIGFVSTMQDLYATRLETIETLAGPDKSFERFFRNLHQQTVTIHLPGDSNSLLLPIFVPLYDTEACEEVIQIVNATSNIQSHYTIMVVGLGESLGHIISPEKFRDITAEDEVEMKTVQKEMLQKFADLRQEQNTLEQIVVMQNINSNGFALNLDEDSLLRIIGEMSLICVEKYNTIFTQATVIDREHPVKAFGLSVMNLDKYYFGNYLLRRAYLKIMEREEVMAENVDLNKVAIIANECLRQHKNLFSDFYNNSIMPLWRNGTPHNTIAAQAGQALKEKFDNVSDDLTAYVMDPQYSLPEKRSILAMILGYDDDILRGNLFADQQLTIDNLDEEVANCFIDANNACVRVEKSDDGEDVVVEGPLGHLCADENGIVKLPIAELQSLRNDIRQSTNYIRERSRELEEIDAMRHDAVESEKRLTENGFVINNIVYHFDIKHEEVKFDETYEPAKVIESSVDLREFFTPIKNQGQIGACTVFSIASIYEYILKKNSQQENDLSESFVYYNVRYANGEELQDTGSSFQDVIKSIGEQGICTESLHPYAKSLSERPSDEAYLDGKKRRITKALNVNVKEEDIKSAIQEGYPVAISLKIYDSFHTTSGFIARPTDQELASERYGHHAMVIVGYSDETKYFIVRNSWGENFGDKGYCYVPYSYICDSNLNRMACIVKEVDCLGGIDITVSGGGSGRKQTVYFNMADAIIRTYIIKNLIEEEQVRLKYMQKVDANIRMDYEMLMQTLGRQPMRTQILDKYLGVLKEKGQGLRERYNSLENQLEEKLRTFKSETNKNKAIMIGAIIVLMVMWFGIYYIFFDSFIDWIQNEWSWIFVGLSGLIGVILSFYWWYAKGQYRQLKIDLEDQLTAVSVQIQNNENHANEQKIRMHIAGMIIDNLLTLKASLDKKYQGLKAYVANLAQWYEEEQKGLDEMEPITKDPFIPLLSNGQLNDYFYDNQDEITRDIHLYEYFNGFQLDDEAIIAYKHNLKQLVLRHIQSLLGEFTIFRHICGTQDYAFLDDEYASAQHLLPVLEGKSVPFCQIKTTATQRPQARFLFIHIDAGEEQSWNAECPKYFGTTPIYEDIVSVYKIIGLRIQGLRLEEVNLD